MQKLPRLLETNPENISLFSQLQGTSKIFFPMGKVKVPHVELSENLIQALAFARRCGTLQGGLEKIQALLRTEEAGLKTHPHRISRILLFSDDGAERFYRQCESLLLQYEKRVLGLKVAAPSSLFGSTFFGKEKSVKAMMVCHKDAVIKVLVAILQAK